MLRYYTHKEDISSRLISYRNPEKLIQDDQLTEPVKKVYSNHPELLLARTFSEVSLDDFRWKHSHKPSPKKVEKFRKHYCTWKGIGNYYGIRPEEIKDIVEENDLDVPKKQENSFIDAPVLEVELFWNLAKKLQNSKITLERVLEIMKKEAGWKERRTNAYLCRYNIKADIGRLKSQKRTKRPLNKVKENLNPAEHLVAEKVDYEIQKLQSYGADFIDSENNVIEVKKSLHKYNIKHALLQLIYAKDTLKKVKELKIYTKNYELSQENISTVKRMLNFYKIKIYSFDPEKDKFVKKNI